jgi:hypothetical protein
MEHPMITFAETEFQPADLVFTRGAGRLSRMIRWATRGPKEAPTLTSHVAGVVNSGSIRDIRIVESLGRVRSRRLLEAYGGTKTAVTVYRAMNLSDQDRNWIAGFAARYINARYPYHRLALHLLDEKILGGALFFRRLVFMKRWRECHYLWADAYFQRGYKFGVDDLRRLTPDAVLDFVQSRPDKYALVLPMRRLPAP